jgi:uncharacterized protein YndB with AHSA1/START domain
MPTAAATVGAARPSLTLQRRLNASPAQVYAAWTDPEKIARWFGPAQIIRVEADMDVRVGGHFRIAMFEADQAPGEEHGVSGIYRELVPGRRLVFSWAWRTTPERESLVTVTIKGEGKHTLLTLLHEQFFDEDARTGHTRGWTGSLDKLEKMFA